MQMQGFKFEGYDYTELIDALGLSVPDDADECDVISAAIQNARFNSDAITKAATVIALVRYFDAHAERSATPEVWRGLIASVAVRESDPFLSISAAIIHTAAV